ncbi:hypothetical protein EV192_118115 [Actinocrispum wychmicini]|uniref:Uncharacterized protein n=1 Tax=Actinocrispum wychmicini TaxID=1213861 RepID=A0A4V6NNK2_9PSEU|nr:hypothetical protein EV192_118115 [Actinocrispum wychmicini]
MASVVLRSFQAASLLVPWPISRHDLPPATADLPPRPASCHGGPPAAACDAPQPWLRTRAVPQPGLCLPVAGARARVVSRLAPRRESCHGLDACRLVGAMAAARSGQFTRADRFALLSGRRHPQSPPIPIALSPPIPNAAHPQTSPAPNRRPSQITAQLESPAHLNHPITCPSPNAAHLNRCPSQITVQFESPAHLNRRPSLSPRAPIAAQFDSLPSSKRCAVRLVPGPGSLRSLPGAGSRCCLVRSVSGRRRMLSEPDAQPALVSGPVSGLRCSPVRLLPDLHCA